MAMTKKDFELLAAVNEDVIWTYGEDDPRIVSLVMRQCFAFKKANPRFDPLRYLIASGFSDDEATDIARRIG